AAGGGAADRGGKEMSIEDDPKKSRDAEATPEWHRARAKDLRRNGFTKMAEEHEQIARTIERQRRGEQETKVHQRVEVHNGACPPPLNITVVARGAAAPIHFV